MGVFSKSRSSKRYYYKNREKILKKQKEIYNSEDRKKRKERIKERKITLDYLKEKQAYFCKTCNKIIPSEEYFINISDEQATKKMVGYCNLCRIKKKNYFIENRRLIGSKIQLKEIIDYVSKSKRSE